MGAKDLDLGDGDVLVAEDVTPVVVGFLILGGDRQFLEGEILGDVGAHGREARGEGLKAREGKADGKEGANEG